MKSDAVRKGMQQAPHRSLFNALGMTEEEIARMQEQMQQRMQGGPGDVSGGDAMSEGGTVPEGNSGDRERPQGRPGDESSESDNTTDGNVGDDVRGEEQQGGQTQS